MKRFICRITFVMVLMVLSSSYAEELTVVDYAPIQTIFSRYSNYEYAENGDWVAHTQEVAHLLDTIKNGKTNNLLKKGACVLYPVIRGNGHLGYIEVILKVALFRPTSLGAEHITIMWEGHRTDINAIPEVNTIGQLRSEVYSIPLDDRGMNMLRSIASKGCDITFYAGAKQSLETISTTPNTDAKSQLERETLSVITSFLEIIDGAGYAHYSLWDLNEHYWDGDRVNIEHVSLQNVEIGTACSSIHYTNGLVDLNDRESVKALQQMLYENRFYAGEIDGKMGAGTKKAVSFAQKYYGLQENGFPDSRLIVHLARINSTDTTTDKTNIRSMNLENEKEGENKDNSILEITRCWTARGLQLQIDNRASSYSSSATAETEGLRTLCPGNENNQFLIFEATFINSNADRIMLPMHIQASIIIDGKYNFPCSVRSIDQDGVSLDISVLPLASTQIIMYTEVPSIILSDIGIEWELHIAYESCTLNYPISIAN